MDKEAREPQMHQSASTSVAYDPNNLHPDDEEARKHDEPGTDWDEIFASTQDDFLAGRYCFSTGDYPTHEAGMAALWNWMCAIGQGENDASASAAEPHAESA